MRNMYKYLCCFVLVVAICFSLCSCLSTSEDTQVVGKGDLSFYSSLTEDEFNEKYDDKYIEVTGVVSSSLSKLVYIGSYDDDVVFHCYFDDEVDNVDENMVLTVRGKVYNRIGKTVTLKKCEVLSCEDPIDTETGSEETTSSQESDTESADDSSDEPTSESSQVVSSMPEESKPSDAHKHTYSKATCTEPKTCSGCGETSGVANGHSWKDATYYDPKTCTVCGKTEGTAVEIPNKENYHGHVYTGGEYSKRFHYEAECAGKNSHEITWDAVSSRGLTPCNTCVNG